MFRDSAASAYIGRDPVRMFRETFTKGTMKFAMHNYNPSRLLATTKGRNLTKTLNNFKVTILCGFITILVLRGTLGSGGLGSSTPEVAELKEDMIKSQRARVLAQVDEAVPDEVTASKFVEEEDRDPSKPYSLGPKISNWDEQRELWNQRNQGRNTTLSGKPKTLLVSGSQPGPCANPLGDFYHLKYLKNRVDYARLHGLEIFYNMAHFDKEMSSFWAKLPLLRMLMLNNPDVEWIWWMDSDAVFTDMTFEMPMQKYVKKNLIVHGFHNLLFEQHRWIGLNTGSFLIRNCQWSLDLLDAWAPFGPEGPTRVEAGKMLTAKLVDRPTFEADDQSALVYLILFDDPKWKANTHIEWEFFLHGYWKYLTYNYEDMMAKNHPGFGDERWPFVTHFVGCKPCKLASTPENEECFKQMERAFNFADNQILEKYGYTHKALGSYMTQRIRKETADPLGLQKDLDDTAARATGEQDRSQQTNPAEQDTHQQTTESGGQGTYQQTNSWERETNQQSTNSGEPDRYQQSNSGEQDRSQQSNSGEQGTNQQTNSWEKESHQQTENSDEQGRYRQTNSSEQETRQQATNSGEQGSYQQTNSWEKETTRQTTNSGEQGTQWQTNAGEQGTYQHTNSGQASFE